MDASNVGDLVRADLEHRAIYVASLGQVFLKPRVEGTFTIDPGPRWDITVPPPATPQAL